MSGKPRKTLLEVIEAVGRKPRNRNIAAPPLEFALSRDGTKYTAKVPGSRATPYNVTLSRNDRGRLDSTCTCPMKGSCKHVDSAAMAIAGIVDDRAERRAAAEAAAEIERAERRRAAAAHKKSIDDALASLDRDELLALAARLREADSWHFDQELLFLVAPPEEACWRGECTWSGSEDFEHSEYWTFQPDPTDPAIEVQAWYYKGGVSLTLIRTDGDDPRFNQPLREYHDYGDIQPDDDPADQVRRCARRFYENKELNEP